MGGIPVYDESKDAVLAQEKLNEVMSNVEKESAFLIKLLRDEQLAADASWARVQSCLLILRYSLAAKLIYFAQTIDPRIVAPLRVFISARFFSSFFFRFFLFFNFLACLEREREAGRDRSPKDPGRSCLLDEIK